MNRQPNRLAAGVAGGFAGSEIDRARPLRFRLNGQIVDGFEGDTVLSAALASGLLAAGTRGRGLLGLDERFAPPVLPAAKRADQHLALPMERTPAIDGLDLETLGARRPAVTPGGPLDVAREWIYGPRRSLGHRFDGTSSVNGPWLDAAPEETIEADLVVVGGGIAGLSAALAAAEAGEHVIVVERRQYLGGDAGFFGVVEGEEPPHIKMPQLIAALGGFPRVEIMLRAEALSLSGRQVRVHQVVLADGAAAGRSILLAAKRVVLTTGAVERLPVFPGNRSPGVTGSVAAFHRAERFGVWLGDSTLFSTVSNQTYRLAMRAAEAGVAVQRVHDARVRPQSRFIDFSKASGVALAFGLAPSSVIPGGRGLTGLRATFTVALDERASPGDPAWTGQLVVSGGWQPDLTLWLTAGGECRWSHETLRFEPAGDIPAVAIAGAAAGRRSTSACGDSGGAAVARLLGAEVPRIEDRQIDPAFETPDAPVPIAAADDRTSDPAYLDGGTSLAAVPGSSEFQTLHRLLGRPLLQRPLDEQSRALSLSDVAAAVQLGVIEAADAGNVASERCILPTTVRSSTISRPEATAADRLCPAYLAGRFGPRPTSWTIDPIEPRDLEPGCLIYANAEPADPLKAIGVVLTASTGGSTKAVALIGRTPAASGDRFVVRDTGGSSRIQLVEKV